MALRAAAGAPGRRRASHGNACQLAGSGRLPGQRAALMCAITFGVRASLCRWSSPGRTTSTLPSGLRRALLGTLFRLQLPQVKSQAHFGELPVRAVGSPEPGVGRRGSDAGGHGSGVAGHDNGSGRHGSRVGRRRRGAHRASNSVWLLSPVRHRPSGSARVSVSGRKPGAAGEPGSATGGVASSSLVRSSGVMALGTLASRVTGMLRTIVLVPALGPYALANAYNVGNTLPNTVYNLAIGGILTSVICRCSLTRPNVTLMGAIATASVCSRSSPSFSRPSPWPPRLWLTRSPRSSGVRPRRAPAHPPLPTTGTCSSSSLTSSFRRSSFTA